MWVRMKNELIADINNYISYLNTRGLSISVHGKLISGLLEHNIHNNPFCGFVKTNDGAWEKCIKCQQKIFHAHINGSFFGMCHAGVEEYVFFVNEKTFISVSGYGINKERAEERLKRLAQDFNFNKSELWNIYEHGLKHETEDVDELQVLVKPLCHMLSLLQLTAGDILEIETKSKMFDSVLAYVQRNMMQDITLRDIAQACACSESTVSHLFKEYMGQPVKKYINSLRMKQAEKLLLTSDLSISDVAVLCGFANTNYFSTAFKKQNGVNPTEYRSRKKRSLGKRDGCYDRGGVQVPAAKYS